MLTSIIPDQEENDLAYNEVEKWIGTRPGWHLDGPIQMWFFMELMPELDELQDFLDRTLK